MAVLKNAINALDPQPDKKKDLTLLLSLLSELCEQRVEKFVKMVEDDLRTAGNGENKTIPVTEILARHKEYRAYVKADAGKIATEVSAAIKKFVSGTATDIIDGVAGLVTTGIEAIIGAGEATQQEMSSYYIVVQDFGIARYDVCVWSRKIEAQGITSQIENALAIVAFKSSADVRKITLNTFLIAYAGQLAKMNFPPDKQLEYLEYAEKIYAKLRGELVAGDGAGLAPLSEAAPFEISEYNSPAEFRGSLWS
jgi:hypothetical protein